MVGKEDIGSVQTHRRGLEIDPESIVPIVHGLDWCVHAPLIGQGYGYVACDGKGQVQVQSSSEAILIGDREFLLITWMFVNVINNVQ